MEQVGGASFIGSKSLTRVSSAFPSKGHTSIFMSLGTLAVRQCTLHVNTTPQTRQCVQVGGANQCW